MHPEWTPWALVAITAVLIPGGVALVTMRRQLDACQAKIAALEAKQERQGAELEGNRIALNTLQTTVAVGFARLEVMLSREHAEKP